MPCIVNIWWLGVDRQYYSNIVEREGRWITGCATYWNSNAVWRGNTTFPTLSHGPNVNQKIQPEADNHGLELDTTL